MTGEEQLHILEALLFASSEPLTQTRVNLVFLDDPPQLNDLIPELQDKFSKENRPLEIQKIAGGYQIITRSEYETWVRRLLNKSGRLTLSQAALETLAIIAYKQPVNRFDIEAIRGVDCSGVLKTILERNLIKIKGRDEGPGRPLLYATTDIFLEYFGLNRIADMPKLKEIVELTESDSKDQLDAFIREPAQPSPVIDQPAESPSA
ncbi:MAG TPA: SMC-Scp complex subunit ScpB [Candidatus Marinimicrobia bacterium]|jgi:segregation and condensation protein B|nr:SMC-Scp complex subunit ScpB [Candidatus Neomarinimicrobiota bacterium]MDP6229451.1 SMC-Scp complex subunit ScpB [Candidatus Neomarinimicrobiota bacterium]MDP7095334.1 SMC-Scp complex subunit ScpB [Candidatus Neomarinimicrobiota bacterium]MDP7512676.1 SMC-Scp complex subunit ScpB [Candidatus Neomarinimicrobiota bacterium]HJM11692.1 SMC-Scp complex subunit ScpB [Candidatus Neomarinimicrobiota bacterium]|tara:strand:+ start:2225 stop:2842 length:618 start_codon:yes stop_codon:yes gene_type:complete